MFLWALTLEQAVSPLIKPCLIYHHWNPSLKISPRVSHEGILRNIPQRGIRRDPTHTGLARLWMRQR